MKQATSQAASDGFMNFVSALTSYSWGRRGKDTWAHHLEEIRLFLTPTHRPRRRDHSRSRSPGVPGMALQQYRGDTAQPCHEADTAAMPSSPLTYYKVFFLAVDLHRVDRVEGRLSRVLPLGLQPMKTQSQTAGSKSISRCPKPPWCNSHLKASWRLPRDVGLYVTSGESRRHLGEIRLPRKDTAPPDPRDKLREGARALRQN